jgi:hypothetical protein
MHIIEVREAVFPFTWCVDVGINLTASFLFAPEEQKAYSSGNLGMVRSIRSEMRSVSVTLHSFRATCSSPSTKL